MYERNYTVINLQDHYGRYGMDEFQMDDFHKVIDRWENQNSHVKLINDWEEGTGHGQYNATFVIEGTPDIFIGLTLLTRQRRAMVILFDSDDP